MNLNIRISRQAFPPFKVRHERLESNPILATHAADGDGQEQVVAEKRHETYSHPSVAQSLPGATETPPSCTTTRRDTCCNEAQFLRCVHLLNLAVRENILSLTDGQPCAGLVATPSPYHPCEKRSATTTTTTSSKVALLRKATRCARLQNTVPVVLSVYRDAVIFDDWNGDASHERLLRGLMTDSRRAPLAKPDGVRVFQRTRCNEYDIPADRQVEDCMAIAFAGSDARDRIVSDICSTYLPAFLEEAYPEGIRVVPMWHGDVVCMLPASPLEFHHDAAAERLGLTPFVSPTTAYPAAAGDEAVHLRPARGQCGHRLGGTVVDVAHRQLQHTTNVAISSPVRTDDSKTSTAVSTTQPHPRAPNDIIVMAPQGRFVFCRRHPLRETWSDVRLWLQRELSVRRRDGDDALGPAVSFEFVVFGGGLDAATSSATPAYLEGPLGPSGWTVRCVRVRNASASVL